MCIYNMRKKQKKKSEKGSVYTYTQNSGKKAFMCIYTREKKKREKGKTKSLYICTLKKKQERKKENPCIYAHQTFGRERLCASIQGKREKEKRGCGYIYTLKKVVCAAITAERKTKEKMEKRRERKRADPPPFFCIVFLHFFALQMYAPLTRQR